MVCVLIQAQADASAAAGKASEAESQAAKVVGETENAYKKLTGTVSEEGNAAKKKTKAQEEDNEVAVEGVEIAEWSANTNKTLFKTKADTTKATEEHTEAVEEETAAFDLLGQAVQAATGFAQEHTDQVKGFFEEAGEKSMELLQEKVKASAEAEKKYGKYVRYMADRILGVQSECEQCFSETMKKAGEMIPPERPMFIMQSGFSLSITIAVAAAAFVLPIMHLAAKTSLPYALKLSVSYLFISPLFAPNVSAAFLSGRNSISSAIITPIFL